jgi:hypothetical protein
MRIQAATSNEELTNLGVDFMVSPLGTELFPGSSRIPITMDNRVLYTDLLAACVFGWSTQSCAEMQEGLLSVLWNSDHNLEIRASLTTVSPETFNNTYACEINLSTDDWWQHTHVQDETGESIDDRTDTTVRLLFDMMNHMSVQDRQRLLRFWTGLRSVPLHMGQLSSEDTV